MIQQTAPSHSPLRLSSSALSVMLRSSSSHHLSGRTKARSSDHLARLPADLRFQSSHLTPLDERSVASTADRSTDPTSPSFHNNHNTSPRQRHGPRLTTDAQRQLDAIRREFILNTSRIMAATPSIHYARPDSPQLLPLGSPGPVTPLMLEQDYNNDEYFLTTTTNNTVPSERDDDVFGEKGQKQLMDGLLREESRQRVLRGGKVDETV